MILYPSSISFAFDPFHFVSCMHSVSTHLVLVSVPIFIVANHDGASFFSLLRPWVGSPRICLTLLWWEWRKSTLGDALVCWAKFRDIAIDAMIPYSNQRVRYHKEVAEGFHQPPSNKSIKIFSSHLEYVHNIIIIKEVAPTNHSVIFFLLKN